MLWNQPGPFRICAEVQVQSRGTKGAVTHVRLAFGDPAALRRAARSALAAASVINSMTLRHFSLVGPGTAKLKVGALLYSLDSRRQMSPFVGRCVRCDTFALSAV